ncbi:CcdC family protein [Paenibacillus sp. MCAF9]|uniref:CcdC family protein n=1 Tax=Paenibacillus sp. MCAF9 TaxID=3233046 RepID=UPI003F9A682D
MDSSFYVFVIVIAALVLWRRTRSFYRPIRGDGKRLLYPILFMLPGLLLIFNSNVHAPFYEFLIAAAIGIILSIPLIWTTNYEIRDNHLIYAKKNWGFIVAFLVVIAIRFELHHYMSTIEPQTLAALFMILAFFYVIPWRVVSYIKFRRLVQLQTVRKV